MKSIFSFQVHVSQQNRFAQELTLLICVVIGSDLSRITDYAEIFRDFPHFLQAIAGIVPQIRPSALPSVMIKLFHHSAS
jgi:hypothetical protein